MKVIHGVHLNAQHSVRIHANWGEPESPHINELSGASTQQCIGVCLQYACMVQLGIVVAADCSLVREHDGSLVLTKVWARSLLRRMGFVKRKGSTSVKVPVPEFEKQKEQYLLDIHAKV